MKEVEGTMKITKSVEHKYLVQYKKEDYYRIATIVFEDGKFEHCDYKTSRSIYNLEDWTWLGMLATAIDNLAKKEK